MSNCTLLFYDLCRAIAEKNQKVCSLDRQVPTSRSSTPTEKHDEEVRGAYTEEAKQIYNHIESLHSFLTSIKPAYLLESTRSGAFFSASRGENKKPLTNVQRDEIDYESRLIIQQCAVRVRELENIEALRQQREANASSKLERFLFRSKDDIGKSNTLALHRRGVTQLLNQKLKDVSSLQTSLQEVRVAREAEKAKSMLNRVQGNKKYDVNNDYGNTTNISSLSELESRAESKESDWANMNPELIQELEQENAAMLSEFQMTLEKAEQAEKSLYEIAALQGELAAHLNQQSEVTQQLYTEAIETMSEVENANKQLQSARKHNRIASKIIIAMSLFFAFFLLFIDYVTS
ncbi:hypothetical protein V1511DRAFT_72367 [Dipodascopsis uninucleata]